MKRAPGLGENGNTCEGFLQNKKVHLCLFAGRGVYMGRGVYIAYCIYYLCLLAGGSGQLERATSTEEKTNLARIVNFCTFCNFVLRWIM